MSSSRKRRPPFTDMDSTTETEQEKTPIKSWDTPISKPSFWSRNPPDNPELVSIIGFFLGVVFVCGLLKGHRILDVVHGQEQIAGFWEAVRSPQLGLYLAFWAVFHMSEYMVTAIYNPTQVKLGSYLLHNGLGYHLAHLCGIFEYLLSRTFFPSLQQYKSLPSLILLGIVITALGQLGRSLAMITAASNFNHDVQFTKSDTHTLVTKGIYQYSRHPSYAAFFYWAVGTQVLLGNPLSAGLFMVVLWRFFTQRIWYEELALTEFFGNDYVEYKKRVGTKIPFCS